jgi:hypothetical protein
MGSHYGCIKELTVRVDIWTNQSFILLKYLTISVAPQLETLKFGITLFFFGISGVVDVLV